MISFVSRPFLFSFSSSEKQFLNFQNPLLKKIYLIAVDFFKNLILFPICFMVSKTHQWLTGKEEIKSFQNSLRLKQEAISRELQRFDNPRAQGKINGIYLTTNDKNLRATYAFIQNHSFSKKEKETMVIGCGGWLIFDYACLTKSKRILNIDFLPENKLVFKKIIDLLKTSLSREVFVDRMIAYILSFRGNEKHLFFHADRRGSRELVIQAIKGELKRPGSWLSTWQNYAYIQRLACKGNIVAITKDFANDENMARLGKFLNEKDIKTTVCYVSNIGDFMKSSTRKMAFTRSLRSLVQKETIIVHCPKHTISQEVILGNALLGNANKICNVLF